MGGDGDGYITQDAGGISFGNGSNESISDGLSELGTNTPADLPSHDNATQSSKSTTTTTTLKLDNTSCVGNEVEDKNRSPTNADADISNFTEDAPPAPDKATQQTRLLLEGIRSHLQ